MDYRIDRSPWEDGRGRRCLGHEGRGSTRQRQQCLHLKMQWKHKAKAVEAQGSGRLGEKEAAAGGGGQRAASPRIPSGPIALAGLLPPPPLPLPPPPLPLPKPPPRETAPPWERPNAKSGHTGARTKHTPGGVGCGWVGLGVGMVRRNRAEPETKKIFEVLISGSGCEFSLNCSGSGRVRAPCRAL